MTRAVLAVAAVTALLGSAAAPPSLPIRSAPGAVDSFFGSVTVFDAGADGDAVPIRVLSGPRTGLRWPEALAVDRSGNLYVTIAPNLEHGDTVYVFAPRADGNVPPDRVIAGPGTGIIRPLALAFDSKDRLYVGNYGGRSAPSPNAVLVYEAQATGDATPLRTLAGGNYMDDMFWPHRLGFDRLDSLYVRTGGVLSVYAPGATGASEPVRYVFSRTRGPGYPVLHAPDLFAVDPLDTLYVVLGDSVMVYAPGYSGTEPAVRQITVPRSGNHGVTGIALDNRGWLYLAERDDFRIKVFPPGATGDVPPARTIKGSRTWLSMPTTIVLDRARRLYVSNGPPFDGRHMIKGFDRGRRP